MIKLNTPYEIIQWDTTECLNGFQVKDGKGNVSFTIYDIKDNDTAENRKNADSVIKALNLHTKLVYTLKRLTELCEEQLLDIDSEFGRCRSLEELQDDMEDMPDELILAYYVLQQLEKKND